MKLRYGLRTLAVGVALSCVVLAIAKHRLDNIQAEKELETFLTTKPIRRSCDHDRADFAWSWVEAAKWLDHCLFGYRHLVAIEYRYGLEREILDEDKLMIYDAHKNKDAKLAPPPPVVKRLRGAAVWTPETIGLLRRCRYITTFELLPGDGETVLLKTLASLPSLKIVRIYDRDLSASQMTQLAVGSSVEVLTFESSPTRTPVRRSTDDDSQILEAISKWVSLREITLQCNFTSATQLQPLAALPQLTRVRFTTPRLTTEDLKTFANFPALEELDIIVPNVGDKPSIETARATLPNVKKIIIRRF